MSKRTTGFERRWRDYYPTIDPAAIEPIKKFVTDKIYFEPCVGEGHLVTLLEPYAKCTDSCDTERNALTLEKKDLANASLFITNPPYTWSMLEPLLKHLPYIAPTLLLLPADMMHNKRMSPYMQRCSTIWSVGRLYWQPNKIKGKDNYVWMYFTDAVTTASLFHGRQNV